jgi:two-component system, LytTR family, sensor kinase
LINTDYKLSQHPLLLRVLVHLLFWMAVLVFYYLLFSMNSKSREVSFILSIGLMPVAVAATCFFNYKLVPEYLWNKRYVQFFLYSFYSLLATTWLSFLIVFFTLIYILTREAYIDPSVLHPEWQVITLYFVVFFAIAVKQMKRLFHIQQEKSQLEKNQLIMELKLKEAELKLLKAQIHPHFLFNTLNNLYGLTLEKSDDAPRLVLRFSELLDYIIYRCNEKLVFLADELKNLNNYLEIEKIRHSGKFILEQKFPENPGKLRIAPLLFIPILENAFKHGVRQTAGKAFVSVKFSLDAKMLNCRIENSSTIQSKLKKKIPGGIGLNNVKKRLELVYPGKYVLNIADGPDSFFVNLILELEE